jgi:ATP-binding cassette subfamily D (ALD) protein 2
MLSQLQLISQNPAFFLKHLFKLLKRFIKRNSKKGFVLFTCCSIAYAYIKYRNYYKKNVKNELVPLQQQQPPQTAPAINKQFLNEIVYLSRIMFPTIFSKQCFYLALHTLTLISRTFLSIYIAQLEGTLVKSIVQKSKHDFLVNILKWLSIAIPATTCNSLIKYLECKLDLELRLNLVNKSLKHYFNDRIYYKIALKQYENIQIDQNLTEDIDKLTHLLVHLYSHLTKPILDVSLITFTLINLAKESDFNYAVPTSIGVAVISLTGMLLRLISPRFGQMAAEEAKRKGYLRFLYTRIQTNSEEIAFLGGESNEYSLIHKNFLLLKSHLEYIYLNKLWYVIFEQFLMKYVWSSAGLTMISIPILIGRVGGNSLLDGDSDDSVSKRTEQFTTARNLLNSAADAVERILTSYKEVIELTGYTRRVYDMFQMFHNCKNTNETLALKNVSSSDLNVEPVMGRIVEYTDESQSDIIIDSISVVTPNGDIIVPSLSLKLKPGMNLLITGPNGCGKSSLFRIISGLWTLYSGTIHRPKIEDFFYIPQKPYLPIGTLRDQIIYPDTLSDMVVKGLNDDDIIHILGIVSLQYLAGRDGGWLSS